MSSILKALRKIEEEKRVANHAAPDLRMDQGNAGKKTLPYLPLFAGIALGALCVGLFALWPSSDSSKLTGRLLEEPNVVNVPAQPVPSYKVENVVTSPVVTQVMSSEEPVAAESVAAESVATESVVAEPVVAEPVVAEPVVAEPVVAEPVVAEPVVAEPAPVKLQSLPEGVLLKVSETFYHDDPANSMAVVNDLPVMIGTFVDSAVVLEIHTDKVVFLIDENTYDVPVSYLP